ncbi:MAG: hypothetical protein HY225_01540 [Candidatus Vogelbacteria bacterium]|nr:hypothetical protein [Candidatus Vogelbacteria bacterium]
MSEDISKSNIEAEIAELSQKIAEKRKILESGAHIVEERDLVKAAVAEKLSNVVPQAQATQSTKATVTTNNTQQITPIVVKNDSGKSYLDFLDPESRQKVERLVEDVFTKGMEKTFKELEFEEPFVIDAFHDVLTDKLRMELKKRGLL